MTEEELKNKCKERAKIFQQAIESCLSSSPMDCIEWFADRIAELEKENAELKSIAQFQQSSNMKRHFEIQELEKKNKKLESVFRICEKNADTYYDQLNKAKEILEKLANLEYAINPPADKVRSLMVKAEQFLKEIEK